MFIYATLTMTIKRLHYKLEMYNKAKNTLSATTEVLSLYIDLNVRKVAEIEGDKKNTMDEFYKPT